MSRVLVFAGLLAGCFKPNYDGTACGPDRSCPSGYACNTQDVCTRSGGGADDAAPDDGAIAPHDSSPDAPPTDAMFCLGRAQSIFRPCFASPPSGNLSLTGAVDTSAASSRCDATASNAEVCVIVAGTILIPSASTVTPTGSRALVLAATTTVQIDGTVDLTGHSFFLGGAAAGSQLGPCNPGTLPNNLTGGGGAGGSFIRPGAGGGTANGSMGTQGAVISAVPTLRGGCAGQSGATGQAGGAGGRGGSGGGALYVMAGTSITVNSAVVAGGGGGAGGADSARSGGGGGGSGGLIGFDAPAVNVGPSASILANGGGGAEGSAGMPPGGMGGEDASSKQVAAGGAGTSSGGDGGSGGFGSQQAMAGLPPFGGGGAGGGGGGMGLIRVIPLGALNQTGGSLIVPPPQ